MCEFKNSGGWPPLFFYSFFLISTPQRAALLLLSLKKYNTLLAKYAFQPLNNNLKLYYFNKIKFAISFFFLKFVPY